MNSVFCEGTDHQEIINICKTLRPGTAAGYDDIHMDVIKNNIDLISEPLAKVINLSITTGIVPSELKIAQVIRRSLLIIGLCRSYQSSLNS